MNLYLTEQQLEHLIFRLEEADKAISGKVAFDPVMRAQTSILFNLGLKDLDLMKSGYKLFDRLTAEFKTGLMNVYTKYSGGTLNYAEALASWKGLTGQYYGELFRAGAMSAGNPFYRDIGLMKADQAFIASARRAEQKYFSKFLMDVNNPNFKPVHPFEKRALYYADSAKSQFFNGMLAGAGDDIEISWVLGPNDNHCHDCITLSQRTYTWKTLPTTPRAGDTECLMNCGCLLEVKPSKAYTGVSGGLEPTVFGTLAQVVSGRRMLASVMDQFGHEVTGALRTTFNDLYTKMYQARQMIHLEPDALEKREWIKLRKEINQQIIDLAKVRGIRTTPGVSVTDLLTASDQAALFGGKLVYSLTELVPGNEVIVLRGAQVFRGVVKVVFGTTALEVTTSHGLLVYSENQDIIFKLSKKIT